MQNIRERLDIIDSIRFIACFIVVMGHFNIPGFTFGWIGVDIFFVVSGFVVTRSLEGRIKKKKRGIVVAPQFIIDRFIRLYPALIFAVFLGALFTILFSTIPNINSLFEVGLSAVGSQSNNTLYNIGVDYFALDTKSNFFTHTWSLGVEFQIYLIIAIVTCIFPKWVFLPGKILIFPVILLLIIWMTRDTGWSYLTIDRAWEFSVGVISYKFARYSKLNKIILFLFLFTVIVILIASINKPISIFLIVISTALILVFNANSKTTCWYQNFFSILARQGRATYSIYLIHWPIAVLLHETYGFENYLINIFAIIITWFLGLFSYIVFEKFPVTVANKSEFELSISKKTQAVLLILTIYLFGAFSSYTSSIGQSIVKKIFIEFNPNFDTYVPLIFQGIPRIQPLDKLDPCHYLNSKANKVDFFKFCLQDIDKSKSNFYLIGDSHAQMLQYGLRPAVENMGRNFYWIHNDGIKKIIGQKAKQIPELDYVITQLSKDDILAFTFFRGKLNKDNNLNLSKDISYTQKLKMQKFEKFFIDNIMKLVDEGVIVILINDGPRLRLNLRAQVCQIREKLSGKDICMLSNEISKFDRLPMTVMFNYLASLSKNIFVIDYHDQLCSEECSYKGGDNLIMIDFNHISKDASLGLENFWIDSLRNLR